MEPQPSASEQADKAIERMRVREAEVMGHRLAALEAMRAQAQAQVDAAQEQMQAKKLERVDKAVRHDRRLKRVTNYKMAEDAKRSAKNIIQPDATWKSQRHGMQWIKKNRRKKMQPKPWALQTTVDTDSTPCKRELF